MSAKKTQSREDMINKMQSVVIHVPLLKAKVLPNHVKVDHQLQPRV